MDGADVVASWQGIRREWTWPEVLLIPGGRARAERCIAYERDVRETETPPLVAWAVDKWLKEHEQPSKKVMRTIDL